MGTDGAGFTAEYYTIVCHVHFGNPFGSMSNLHAVIILLGLVDSTPIIEITILSL
jgi:hypothetical protein